MRRSLLKPPYEFILAAKLLDAASEALLCGKLDLASKLIVESDFSELKDYLIRMVGPLTLEVHRQTKRPKPMPKELRDPKRMPTASLQYEIFARDGWKCRFCGIPVISRKARNILVGLFPEETRWRSKEYDRHPALNSMAVSLDHVEPHSRGGKNEKSNFVTACYCCQFGRGEWTLEESELADPRDYLPIVDSWDGLARIENLKSQKVKPDPLNRGP